MQIIAVHALTLNSSIDELLLRCILRPLAVAQQRICNLKFCSCSFICTAGAVPFKSDSIMGLYNEICNKQLVFPPEIFVSNSLKHLLSRLLDKDPDTRISLTGAMHHHWVTHNGGYPLPNIQVYLVRACKLLRKGCIGKLDVTHHFLLCVILKRACVYNIAPPKENVYESSS